MVEVKFKPEEVKNPLYAPDHELLPPLLSPVLNPYTFQVLLPNTAGLPGPAHEYVNVAEVPL